MSRQGKTLWQCWVVEAAAVKMKAVPQDLKPPEDVDMLTSPDQGNPASTIMRLTFSILKTDLS